MSKLLIKNGTIVTSEKITISDILLSNGKIEKIGKNITGSRIKKIDAENLYIFPGMIDAHVHLNLPSLAGNSSDDFETGSKAAIAGGTTAFIDFVTPKHKESMLSALKKRKKEASKSLIDYGFHVSPTWWGIKSADEMKQCIDNEGVSSFKVYLAYKNSIGIDDNIFIKVLETAKNIGGLVTIHCENGDLVDHLRAKYVSQGNISPKYHPISRPIKAETEAIGRAIALAKVVDCPIYIVHVSSKAGIDLIEKARRSGQKVFAETCPQYLLLDERKYNLPDFESAAYVISPPLRTVNDQNGLWKALNNKIIDVIATDHCPFNLLGQKDIGKDNFTKIPNGAGGIEHRLSLLYTYGVLENRITIKQMVNVLSTMPAKIFGIANRKGDIKEGLDADLVIWNPATENNISVKNHHQKCDRNIFEGFITKGSPQYVIVDGKIAFENDQFADVKLKGKYLKRQKL